MTFSAIDRTPSERTLRQFSFLMVLFFGGQGLWKFIFGVAGPWAYVCVLGSLFGLIGLWVPRLMRSFFVGWMIAAFPIGWVVSRITLGIVYYLLFTPVAFGFRAAHRDRLVLRMQPEAQSYWKMFERRSSSSYLKQY